MKRYWIRYRDAQGLVEFVIIVAESEAAALDKFHTDPFYGMCDVIKISAEI